MSLNLGINNRQEIFHPEMTWGKVCHLGTANGKEVVTQWVTLDLKLLFPAA